MQNASLRKICYLAPDVTIPYPSGAAVHLAEVTASLREMGYDVHLIARRSSYAQPKLETVNGVTVHRIKRFILIPGGRRGTHVSSDKTSTGLVGSLYYFYLRTIFMFYASLVASRVISRHSLDAIVERETSFGAGGLASLLTRKPLILEIVGPRYSRLSARLSSSILYYTDSMLRSWVDRKKCVLVTAGVNLGLFRPDTEARKRTRSELRLGDEPVIGYVGSFQEWHGVDIVLHAASMLKARGTRVALLLVGPSFNPYVRIAKILGISEQCKFVGPVGYKDVPSYINASDILVAPYNPAKDPLRREFGIGFPIKILEYMACEKPVVSTTVPPISSILGDSDSILLVEPGNPAMLADALEGLMHNPGRASQMAKNGIRLVTEKYSWASFTRVLSSQIAAA